MESIEAVEKPSLITSSSTKCKREKGSEIVDAICEMRASCMQLDLPKCELDLMQQKEAQMVKEEQLKEGKRSRAQGQRAPLQ